MQLVIKTMSGVKHNINCEPSDKINLLKKEVEKKTGIDPVQQRLGMLD